MALLTLSYLLSYLFWGFTAARKKANKKQKIVILIAALLLAYLSFVPVTIVLEPGNGSARVLGAPRVELVSTPCSFFVFFASWLLVYFFRDRRSQIL